MKQVALSLVMDWTRRIRFTMPMGEINSIQEILPGDIRLEKFLEIGNIRFSGVLVFSLLTFLSRLIFNLCKSKKELIVQISIQQKEIEILKRKQGRRRIRFLHSDRIVFSIVNRVGHLEDRLTLVKPETVLRWQRQLFKHFWNFKRTK